MPKPECKEAKTTQYPSTDLTYRIALDSYEQAERRFESTEARLDKLLAVAMTTNIAVVTYLVTTKVAFWNAMKVPAVFLFLVGVCICVGGRLFGGLQLLTPVTLRTWMHKPEEQFKHDVIYRAAEASDANRRTINIRGYCFALAAIAFLLEALLVCAGLFHP